MPPTNDYLNTEDLLKSYHHNRRASSKAVQELTAMLTPKGTNEIKDDYIDTHTRVTASYSGDRVQNSPQPDKHMIRLVDSIGQHMTYTTESIRRRLKYAITELENLDRIEECVQYLPGKQREILTRMYLSPNPDTIDHIASDLGYSDRSGLIRARQKAISALTTLIRKSK